jgi:hypothetical protein
MTPSALFKYPMPRQTSVRALRVFGYSGREDVRGRNEPGRYER